MSVPKTEVQLPATGSNPLIVTVAMPPKRCGAGTGFDKTV
jgi:hypothetical protein